MKLQSVKYIGGYSISVSFEDDVKGEIDLTELVNKGIFQSIKDVSLFKKAFSTGYSIAWNDDLEIECISTNNWQKFTRNQSNINCLCHKLVISWASSFGCFTMTTTLPIFMHSMPIMKH